MAKIIGLVLRSQKTHETVKFYAELLGASPTVRVHGLSYMHVDIGLFAEDATFAIDSAVPPLSESRLTIQVEDLEKSRTIVDAYGGTFDRVVEEGKMIYVRDPEGRLIALVLKAPDV